MPVILVVEDEPFLCLDISEVLRGEGYDVITTTNADDAIEALQSRTDICTIFTDIHMPGSMDGLKLAAAVRERWPPVNIIVTTGMRAPRSDELPARALFIAKPYRTGDVVEAMRSFGVPFWQELQIVFVTPHNAEIWPGPRHLPIGSNFDKRPNLDEQGLKTADWDSAI